MDCRTNVEPRRNQKPQYFDTASWPFLLRTYVLITSPLIVVGFFQYKTATRTGNSINTTTHNGAGFIFASVEKALYFISIFKGDIKFIFFKNSFCHSILEFGIEQ